MTWQIEIKTSAIKELKRLDRSAQQRIIKYLQEQISNADNPRSFGKALSGNLSGLWCYRVGDYRIICRIEDEIVKVLVMRIGHRKDIYE